MGLFREAMLRELKIRGYAAATCELYVGAMRDLVRYHMRAPDKLTPADVNAYQYHLIAERRVSYSTFNIAVSAFRFFYRTVVPVEWSVDRLPYHRKPRALPVILSRAELRRIFGAVESEAHRAALLTIYAGGLRLGEACRLRVGDIDPGRKQLRVRAGKGAKDRYVPLSEVAHAALRPRVEGREREEWVFPGKRPEKPVDPSTLQRAFKGAVRIADVQKRVSVHSLRHAFATHLLEDGTHVRALQRILGHTSLKTTTIYLHCTEEYMGAVRSPLDRLADGDADVGRG